MTVISYRNPRYVRQLRQRAHDREPCISAAVCAFLWARADYAARQGPPHLSEPIAGSAPRRGTAMQPSRLPGTSWPTWQASGHHVPGAGRAVTTCDQAPSRPGMPGGPRPAPVARSSTGGTLGRYWGHGPGHRDNPRRDPRHLACRHRCGRDLRDAQDVCHHRTDRDGRLHRGVARGQAPQRRLARPPPPRVFGPAARSGQQAGQHAGQPVIPGARPGPGCSMATNDTHLPATSWQAGTSSGKE